MHKMIFTSEAMSFFACGSSLRNKKKLLPGDPSIKGHSGSSAWRQMGRFQQEKYLMVHKIDFELRTCQALSICVNKIRMFYFLIESARR